ncbi:hypothetical protein CRV24_006219 [Beauveria bassiana]|nr:hypothetical protein CRV24_006219 [Beauveria bassiana]KAH8708780.1 hypothetical protein HC256_008720 [Beauveria bassiana]
MAALRRFGLLLTLSICIACSIADRNSGIFSKPPGSAYGNFALNAVYPANEDIEFAWSYANRPIDLLLERVDLTNLSATSRKWVLKSAISTQNYTWTPDGREEYLNDPDDGGLDTVFVASLSFVGAKTTIWRTPSHYFNVSRAALPLPSTPSQVDESPKSGGPSAATIAGIAISAVLIFVAVLGTVLLLFWRRSRRAKRPHRPPSQTSSMRNVLRAPKSMDEVAAAKESCSSSSTTSSSSSSSSSSGSCNEERHAELHAQNVVIAELPGSCWTDFTPELPGVWRIRRSGDSWEPDAPERLDVRPCNAVRRDLAQSDEKIDLEKDDDEDRDEGTEDTGRPATPPPQYATCGSHTLEPFLFNSLEYQVSVKEQDTNNNT